jgi:hypothetical protein
MARDAWLPEFIPRSSLLAICLCCFIPAGTLSEARSIETEFTWGLRIKRVWLLFHEGVVPISNIILGGEPNLLGGGGQAAAAAWLEAP